MPPHKYTRIQTPTHANTHDTTTLKWTFLLCGQKESAFKVST